LALRFSTTRRGGPSAVHARPRKKAASPRGYRSAGRPRQEWSSAGGETAMTSTTSITDLKVRDLMTPGVVSVRPDDSVAAAYELMLDHRFRHLAVIDGEGDLVGLLTHRDLLRHSLIERAELPLGLQRAVMRRIRVEEVMTSEVETVEPDLPLEDAALNMFENKYGCLPVVESSRVVGILTEADFVRFFALAGRQPVSVLPAVFGRQTA